MPNNILITPGSASITFSGSAANNIRLQVEPSGNLAFYGNSGTLFGITDSLSGSLMSVNDISGLPILEVFSDDRVVMGSYAQNTLIATGSRVGVKTANPQSLLHVSGTVSYGSIRISPSAATGESAIAFFDDIAGTDTNDAWVVGHAGWGNTGDFVIGNENNGAGGNVRLLIEKSGNVGIGTTSPATPLDVNGGAAGTGGWNRTATLSATFPTLIFNSNGTKWGGIAYDYSAAMRFWVNAGNNDIYSTTAVMSILNNGNVGIGTTSPGTLLDVNGVARATTFTSTQATGTAPFSVSSTTAVSNLNADLLDGYHAASFYLASNPSGYTTNTGTVTSVAGTGTVSGLSLSGTVTTTGNITLGGTLSVAASNFSSQTANTFLAAPNGSAGTPTFRAIAAADVPTLNQNTTGTAANITAYTINQNLGTGNAPSFSGLTSTSTLTIGGKIQRSAAGVGYLDGNYSGVETINTSGAIYSIGGSYVPGTTTLGNMYGVGYGYSGGTAIGNPGSVPSSVWGMYVASNGTGRIFLDSDNGRGYFASNLYVGGTQVVYNSGTWSISVSGNAGTVTNGMYLSGDQSLSGIKAFYTPSGQTFNASSGNIGLTVFNPAAGDAMMTFHVSGDYAGYFGLGGAENDLVWTGWSVGNNRYRIWHSGNDGAGSGLDADLWDGYQFSDYLNQAVKSTSAPTFDSVNIYDTTAKVYKSGGRLTIRSETTDDVANFASYGLYLPKSGQTAGLYAESPIEARSGIRLGSGATNGTIDYGATTTNTGNRLVLRDANGDINSRYANSSYVNTSDDVSTGTITYIMAKFGDNYYRSATAAKVAAFISGQSMNIAGNASTATSATSATYLNSSNYIQRVGSSGNYNTDFNNTPAGSVRHLGDDYQATNNPGGSWWFVDNYRHSNGSNSWGTQVAWGWEDNANRLATRNISGGSFGGWVYYLNSANYTSYAPSLTGTGASGTWGISISGNAATATTSGQVTINYSNDSNSTYQMLWGSGNYVYGTSGVYVNPYTDYVYAASWNANDWFRSSGATGWYNSDYTGGIFMQDTTWVRVYNSKAFYVANEIAATGNITAYYSDERLKTKVASIDNAIEKIKQLNGFIYVENELARSLGYSNPRQQIGVSAQEVQKILPEAVSLAPVDMETSEFTGEITSKSGENYLTVSYERLVPLLIEAIKELTIKIEKLEGK